MLSDEFADALGPQWRAIGGLAVRAQGGLRPVGPKPAPQQYIGGGIISQASIQPGEVFEFSAAVRIQRFTDEVWVQLVVTDDPTFDTNPQAISRGHELVYWIQGSQLKAALPDGQVVVNEPLKTPDRLDLSVRMNQRTAVLKLGNRERPLYVGPHGLAQDQPRYFGIRFQLRGPDRLDPLTVESVRLLKPSKP